MNKSSVDDFLQQQRQAPPPEFTAALFERISQPSKGVLLTQFRTIFLRPLVKYAVALSIALAILAIISPTVRANILQKIVNVSGFTFVASDRGWDPGPHPTPAQPPPQAVRVGLTTARSQVPYTFLLPTWLPPGVTLQEATTQVAGTSVIVYYVGQDPQVSAFIWRTYQGQGGTGLIGNESTEAVTVNGAPAVLIRGIWDGTTAQWSRPHLVTLHWFQDGVTYEIHANLNSGLTVDDLIRLAESAR